jgi:hypothetical protein
MFEDAEDQSFWEYVFIDYNYDELLKNYISESTTITPAIFTNRTVNATWECGSWPVISGGNGSSTSLTIMLDSNGNLENKTIPFAGGSNQTTFLTDPTDDGCGNGCSIINVFESSLFESWWYECNITIGDVNNATLEVHNIGDDLKALSAQSIALQGHISIPEQNKTGIQFQSYPATSVYGYPNEGYVDAMGNTIAMFAIGVIAQAANWNPTFLVIGDQPEIGSQLKVDWTFVALILGLTAGVQFLLFVLFAMVSNLVIVKDESPFSTARLLRPIVDRMGPRGTYADGEQILKSLGDGGVDKVVYSVRHPQKGILHHLDLGHQKRLRAFPRGDYD